MSGIQNLKRRGRPKGSKHRLSESFLAALAEDFEKHGKDCIAKVRVADTTSYLKIVASLQPKDEAAGGSASGGVTVNIITGVPRPVRAEAILVAKPLEASTSQHLLAAKFPDVAAAFSPLNPISSADHVTQLIESADESDPSK